MADEDKPLARLWRRPDSKWLLGIPIGGFLMLLVGAAGLGTTNFILHETSTTEFCLSCHSHDTNIRPEYEASTHFSNPSGVQAGCADCHIPHGNWFETVISKSMSGAKDVYGEIRGVISTPEKFEAHRAVMAESVWEQYRDNDSRFCRSCHNSEVMDLGRQTAEASAMHRSAQDENLTCIDCHKGIVHVPPADTGIGGSD